MFFNVSCATLKTWEGLGTRLVCFIIIYSYLGRAVANGTLESMDILTNGPDVCKGEYTIHNTDHAWIIVSRPKSMSQSGVYICQRLDKIL
jgi:hypothetical protein